ncbi:selenocysteine-specific translation elongation factor [Alkalibacillus aidingensis]|uniref:selenocysteine-specific translation elongation factor n=1 Tax=Alkalibacillus aidingensis TaxID=2747607 RepID=UPI0016606D80|nr:selenocysteine-specific translation elongation factor [Alkalibacillus aidingensis]
MDNQNYTIGMAGHIDHGKTELTKALTGYNTDRLQEEKDRKISIELGYAPLWIDPHQSVSIIDVPGHERFIRQMIAGVANIDLALVVVAADEGVMPQTIEHMEILTYLEIKQAFIVVTKADTVEEDLKEIVISDLKEQMVGTIFENQPLFQVDSISKTGIKELKDAIHKRLSSLPKKENTGTFRMPIDQTFHVHGTGTVVRGTIAEGSIQVNEQVTIQPQHKNAQIRSIQHFGEYVNQSYSGNRTAIALKGIDLEDINRGDVLTCHSSPLSTSRLDVELKVSPNLTAAIKQRAPIKFHTGTSETYGRVIFFDRNKLESNDEQIYAQVELDDPIFAMRDDYYVLRRATPVETIGGGKIIEAQAEKHRFGKQTIRTLHEKAQSSSDELIIRFLNENPGATQQELIKAINLDLDTYRDLKKQLSVDGRLLLIDSFLFSTDWINEISSDITNQLEDFHKHRPLLIGLYKSELIQKMPLKQPINKKILDYLIDQGVFKQVDHYMTLPEFEPHIPSSIQMQAKQVVQQVKTDQLKVKPFLDYTTDLNKQDAEDLKSYLIHFDYLIALTEELLVDKQTFMQQLKGLREQTGESFTLKEAKDYLGVSRKYLIPFLEKLDELKFTKRDEQKRFWS